MSWQSVFGSRNAGDGGGCGFLSAREIDAWLAGTLTGTRVAAFEGHQLAGCGDCALFSADLHVFRAVSSRGLLVSERREYERTRPRLVARLGQELATRLGEPRPWAAWLSWRPLAGAAAAALLLAFVAVPMLLQRGAEGTILLPSGAVVPIEPIAFSAPPTVRDAQSQAEAWRQAEAAYSSGDYGRAEQSLAQIVEREPGDHDATLYRGVALLMLGRYEDAEVTLHQARRLAEAQGLTGAIDDYYLGLAALGRGARIEARELLERARDAGGSFGRQAGELLERIARD